MRRPLTFACEGATLAGVAHPADGAIGVVVVTGGVQTRVGAHRGFVDLADALAAAGHPVLRYDRRGLGDSDGEDPGFRDSRADIAAAVSALRAAFPNVTRVAGWGLCDGAAALALHAADIPGLDALMLANPWTLDADAPPPVLTRAATAARYRKRLFDPGFWKKLVRGRVDLGSVASGLTRLTRSETLGQTEQAMGQALARFKGPTLALLAGRDNSANTFAAAWRGPAFAAARDAGRMRLMPLPQADHSFSRTADAGVMATACVDWLKDIGSSGRI